MSSTITPFKKLDLSKILITRPDKFKGKYRSFIAYNGAPLYIQTSSFQIAPNKGDEGCVSFAVNRRSSFQECMTRFDAFCTNYITEHRDTFFPGKKFNHDKVPNSWVPSVKNNIFSATLDKSVLLRNQLDQPITAKDLTQDLDAVAVVYVADIVYSGSNIQVSYIVQQMKVFQSPELKQWLLDLDSDSEDDIHTLRDACFVPLPAAPEPEDPRPLLRRKTGVRPRLLPAVPAQVIPTPPPAPVIPTAPESVPERVLSLATPPPEPAEEGPPETRDIDIPVQESKDLQDDDTEEQNNDDTEEQNDERE